MTPTHSDPDVAMLRHSVATLAYRAAKAIRGVHNLFGGYRVAPDCRSAGEILAHVGDLFDWALCLADGRHEWRESTPQPWDREVERFFAVLAAFDARLASGVPLGFPATKLFQGPVADALTHVGQISLLRRLAGHPVKAENYFKANIETGRVGGEQATPVREF